MADRIEAKSMSYDDWKALGPLFHAPEPEGDNYYDGTTQERPTTPKWASLSLGGPNKILGNPNHSSRNDAFTNAHSQWMHIMKTLDAGDTKALKLVREAAKAGDKMAGLSERMHGDANAWVALASDAETAEVIRGFITTTLEHFPAASGVRGQELPKNVDDLPLEALKKDMENHRPKRFRKRILENGVVRFVSPDNKEASNDRAFASAVKNKVKSSYQSKPRRFAGTIAIFADDGMENAAADYVKDLDSRLLPCPEKNGALWKAVGEVRPKGAFYPREYDPNLKQNQAADQLVGRADAVAVFVNGDPTSRASSVLAQASRLGKAVKVIGPDRREMPLMETAREAEASHMSKKEIAQSFSSHVFDVAVSDPLAYLGLSQVRSHKFGSINEKDLNRLATMKETVNDIADMATNEGGQEYLRDEMKITPGTIRLLGDSDAMASARDTTLKLRGELTRHDMDVIGPQDYPESILRTGNFPPYMIVEGDKDFLRHAQTMIGITGKQAGDDRERRIAASTGTKAVSALTMQPATIAYVQGQTNVATPETGPQVMVAPTGAAYITAEERAQQRQNIENGGVVIHMQPPETRAWHYDAKAKNEKTGKKGAMVPTLSKHDPLIQRRAAELLGTMCETTLVTAFNAKEPESYQHVAVRAGLVSGRLPTIVNFSGYQNLDSVSGNRAMLGSTGTRALTRAGFGNRDIETLGPKFEGRKPAIDTGKNMTLAMQNLVRHLNGQEIQVPQNAKARDSRVDAAEL